MKEADYILVEHLTMVRAALDVLKQVTPSLIKNEKDALDFMSATAHLGSLADRWGEAVNKKIR
jgi:hypothetical protein